MDDPAGSDAAIPWRSPTMHLVVASSTLGVVGIPLVSPALPLLREQFGVTPFEAGLLITVYALPAVVFTPLIGALADRFGRRSLFVSSLLGYGLFGGGVVLAPTFDVVLALRFLQGIAGGGLVSLALTLVGDVFEGRRRNAVMGMNAAALSAGGSFSPVVGGVLATVSWRAPFVVFFAAAALAVVAIRLVEEPADRAESVGLGYLRDVLDVVPTGRALALYSATFATFALLFGGIHTVLPFLLSASFGLDAGQIGLIITVSLAVSVVVSTQNARLVRYLPEPALVVIAFLGFGAALIGAGLAPSPGLITAALVLFGVGMGIAPASLDTALSRLPPDRYRGGVMSLRTSVKRLGQTVGPAVATIALPLAAYGTLLTAAGVLALAVATLLSVTLARFR